MTENCMNVNLKTQKLEQNMSQVKQALKRSKVKFTKLFVFLAKIQTIIIISLGIIITILFMLIII